MKEYGGKIFLSINVARDQNGNIYDVIINGQSLLNVVVGRPIIDNINGNNHEIAKAIVDNESLIRDFNNQVEIVFRSIPYERGLQEFYQHVLNLNGFFHLRLGLFSSASRVYQQMHETLTHFDNNLPTPLSKGQVLHNLALSQFMQNDFDQAVPNFLRAGEEDHRTGGIDPRQSFAHEVLQSEYITPVLDYIVQQCQSMFSQIVGTTLTRDILVQWFDYINPEDQVFAIQIWKSNQVNRATDNVYSRCKQFDSIKNLCLVAETFFKTVARSTTNTSISTCFLNLTKPDLLSTLQCIFDNQSWRTDISNLRRHYANFDSTNLPCDLNTKLATLMQPNLVHNLSEDTLVRGILLLGLIRNFTSHEFDLDTDLLNQNYQQYFVFVMSIILALFNDLRRRGVI